MKKTISGLLFFFFLLSNSFSQSEKIKKYWKANLNHSIVWNVTAENKLPHSDNFEMDGKKVACIVYYSIDEKKKLTSKRDVIFPQLRTFVESWNEQWGKYRAYFRQSFQDDLLPRFSVGNNKFVLGEIDSVEIKGKISFFHKPADGIAVKRTLFPSMNERLFIEKWEMRNVSEKPIMVFAGNIKYETQQKGEKGMYHLTAYSDAPESKELLPGEMMSFGVYFAAGINDEKLTGFDLVLQEEQRNQFISEIESNLILETPDNTINTLFFFSKIRAAESLYETKMGLVHSPGGGNYYAGIWANDQGEYSSPFFPYLGYANGNLAALNCYKWFLKNKPDDFSPIISSWEMEGDLTCCGLDRGDAAMLAYGASHFALASGRKELALEIWQLIEWCLEYCNTRKNSEGVITSTSDEMEGRISTGGANLATSALYYGALRNASYLSRELGKFEYSKSLDIKITQMESSIEKYFGTTIDGLETYKYFEGNTTFRHWICLPLVMGIEKRKVGTIDALLNKLWTENGILVEYTPEVKEDAVFWDRGTLYALRGTFKAGAIDLSLEKLKAFSEKRLTGDHVPYVVEAYPENNMKHLSAESALYCRIFTEGLLGMEPTGFRSFSVVPVLPKSWDHYDFKNIRAFNSCFDVKVKRVKDEIELTVIQKEKTIYKGIVKSGSKVNIGLKD